MRIVWHFISLHFWTSTMNYPAFILCCLVAMLALAGCGGTTQPDSPAPTTVSEKLQTAAPSPSRPPAAGLKVTPALLPSPTTAPVQTTGRLGRRELLALRSRRLPLFPVRRTPDRGADSITAEYKANATTFMRRIVARKPARHVPSERECGWCEISSEYCSERIEPEVAWMSPYTVWFYVGKRLQSYIL